MNVKAIAIAALVSVAMPAAVLAQSATPAPAVNGAASGAMSAGAGAAAATTGMSTDFNAFMQGFSGADFTNATSGLDAATTVNVVKLSSLQNADKAKLDPAIQAHKSDIAGLSAKIDANAKAKAALDAQGLSSSNVVWIDTGADGTVTLYVNDLDKAAM